MDFDQAFKKLSPFMAFKTFSWILDWMTNDRSVLYLYCKFRIKCRSGHETFVKI